jgi:serine protease Do
MIPGDVITSIAGNPVTELSNMPRIVSRLPVNESIEMTVVREGKAIPVKVMVAPLPEEYPVRQASNIVPQGVTVGEIGITTTDLTPEIAAQLGYPRDARGAVVIGVERGSLAALAGLGRGAVIVRVDKTPIANTKQLGEALAVAMREKGALLYLLKPNGSVEFVVLKLK